MQHRPLRVLLVEDNPGDARLISEMLGESAGESFQVEQVERLEEALSRLPDAESGTEGDAASAERPGTEDEGAEHPAVDVILLDLSLPDATGLLTVRRMLESAGDVPLVVLTGLPDEDQARSAVQEGAQDYLVKGQVTGDLLSRSLRYAVERGRVEAELRSRAEELAEADRRKDRFLAMLSHELRAPLAPILSAAEVMRVAGPLEDRRLEWARQTIARQVRHMAGLLEDLLDLSRITMGKIRIRKRPIPLGEVIEAALSTSRAPIEERSQQLSVSLPTERVWLEADPDRIEQVLINLLRNASAYTDGGGGIRVIVEAEEEAVVIRVEDDGIGMDPSTLERIFEPFAQGPGSAERSDSGLGVGLSLVRTLVELHGGSIHARSAGPGEGSEFEMRLPRLQQVPGADGPDGEGRPRGERMHDGQPDAVGLSVLVVDDNRDTAEGLRLLLSSWGCDVRVAHDGQEALRSARQRAPALMLLDIGLPDLDGYAVARALREDRETAGIQIVAVSGYGQKRDRERARDAGIDAYLVKPVDPAEVRELILSEHGAACGAGAAQEMTAPSAAGEEVHTPTQGGGSSAGGSSERELP